MPVETPSSSPPVTESPAPPASSPPVDVSPPASDVPSVGPSETPNGWPNAGGGGPGGSLPVTGAPLVVPLSVGLGAALVVAGVLFLLAGRRRPVV